MHRLSLPEYVQAAAAAIAVARLHYLGLSSRQPALFAFLIVNAVSLLTFASLEPHSDYYFFLFLLATVLNVAISVVAVREMFALTFDQYPGIRTAGRRVMYGATAISAACSLAITAYFNRGQSHSTSHLYFVEILDRSIVLTLGVVVIAILLTLSYFPLHLSRNTYVSTLFFSGILLSEATQFLLDSLKLHLYSHVVDTAQVVFTIFCLTGWAAMLRREEALQPVNRVVFSDLREAELLRQLESLNRLLGRAGRQ